MTADYSWSGSRDTACTASAGRDNCGCQLRRDPTFREVKRASRRCLLLMQLEFRLDPVPSIFPHVALLVFLLCVGVVAHPHNAGDLTAPQLCLNHYSFSSADTEFTRSLSSFIIISSDSNVCRAMTDAPLLHVRRTVGC